MWILCRGVHLRHLNGLFCTRSTCHGRDCGDMRLKQLYHVQHLSHVLAQLLDAGLKPPRLGTLHERAKSLTRAWSGHTYHAAAYRRTDLPRGESQSWLQDKRGISPRPLWNGLSRFCISLFFFFSILFEKREMVQNMVSTPIWGTGNPYWSHIFIDCIMRMQRYKVAALSLPSTKQQPKYYLKYVNSLHKMNQLTDLFLVFCVPLMSNRHSTVEEVQEG